MRLYDNSIELFKKFYHWLMPYTCILCRLPSHQEQDLCTPCRNELPILPQTCKRCAKTLPPRSDEDICGTCITNPPPFDVTHALFSYQKPITKIIMELKFHQRLRNARLLGELLATAIQETWYVDKPLPDVIIPVPLHKKRLRERGYNQAIEIAKPIAKKLKIPIDKTSCIRIKSTQAQAQLELDNRVQNIQNAFHLLAPIRSQHIAILDDVTTTGQTLLELSKVLKKHGVKRIDIWCCAKTLLV